MLSSELFIHENRGLRTPGRVRWRAFPTEPYPTGTERTTLDRLLAFLPELLAKDTLRMCLRTRAEVVPVLSRYRTDLMGGVAGAHAQRVANAPAPPAYHDEDCRLFCRRADAAAGDQLFPEITPAAL
jgi:hypothetical protein